MYIYDEVLRESRTYPVISRTSSRKSFNALFNEKRDQTFRPDLKRAGHTLLLTLPSVGHGVGRRVRSLQSRCSALVVSLRHVGELATC